MPIILKYIGKEIENNSSHLNDTIKYIFLLNKIIQKHLKTIFIQVNLTMSIITCASMAK